MKFKQNSSGDFRFSRYLDYGGWEWGYVVSLEKFFHNCDNPDSSRIGFKGAVCPLCKEEMPNLVRFILVSGIGVEEVGYYYEQ